MKSTEDGLIGRCPTTSTSRLLPPLVFCPQILPRNFIFHIDSTPELSPVLHQYIYCPLNLPLLHSIHLEASAFYLLPRLPRDITLSRLFYIFLHFSNQRGRHQVPLLSISEAGLASCCSGEGIWLYRFRNKVSELVKIVLSCNVVGRSVLLGLENKSFKSNLGRFFFFFGQDL